jgi:hypothetical protein
MAHPDMCPVSFTCAPVSSLWVITLHNLFLYSDPPIPCHPPSCWLRPFSSQTFSYTNTPTFSNLDILHTYLPMKMEETDCSKMSAYKIQMPGNYPEESIQQDRHLRHSFVGLPYHHELCIIQSPWHDSARNTNVIPVSKTLIFLCLLTSS